MHTLFHNICFHLLPLAQQLLPGQANGGTTTAGAGGAQPVAEPSLFNLPMILMAIFFVMYFLVIRPQQKEQKQREDLMKSLKKNDKVITQGGIIGTVFRVLDKEVILRVDEKNDVRMKFHPSAITHRLTKDDKDGAADSEHEDASADTEEAAVKAK